MPQPTRKCQRQQDEASIVVKSEDKEKDDRSPKNSSTSNTCSSIPEDIQMQLRETMLHLVQQRGITKTC